jgi:hypothetical protein
MDLDHPHQRPSEMLRPAGPVTRVPGAADEQLAAADAAGTGRTAQGGNEARAAA